MAYRPAVFNVGAEIIIVGGWGRAAAAVVFVFVENISVFLFGFISLARDRVIEAYSQNMTTLFTNITANTKQDDDDDNVRNSIVIGTANNSNYQ